MRNRVTCITIFLLVSCFSTQVLAEKTDVVILKNGDRVTGEVKGLASGLLELSTDHMGTVFIDWDNIQEMVSHQGQQIELSEGARLVGTLDKHTTELPEEDAPIIVRTDDGAVEVDAASIVRMYPVGGGFWDRMDLAVSLGFDFDKSSSVGKYNFGIDTAYRDPKFITFGRFSSELTTQDAADNTQRTVLSFQHMIHRPNKRYRSYFGSVEQNDQLGVDLRTLAGTGFGWVPISTGRNWLSWGVGVDVNWEKPFDGSDSDANVEAVGNVRYQYFRRGMPERTLDISFQVFPSITQLGRVRADFVANARWEVIRDFFIGMELFTSFDNESTSTEASDID